MNSSTSMDKNKKVSSNIAASNKGDKKKKNITKDEYITHLWHKRNRVNCFVS